MDHFQLPMPINDLNWTELGLRCSQTSKVLTYTVTLIVRNAPTQVYDGQALYGVSYDDQALYGDSE